MEGLGVLIMRRPAKLWQFLAIVVVLCATFVVSDFTPGCSFVGGQCMYTVQLGHQGQCDSVQPTTTTAPSSQCCETINTELTSVKKDIEDLQVQIAALIKKVNDSEGINAALQNQTDQLTNDRDNLLQTLREKEKELNSTRSELSAIISKAGDEIQSLREAVTNATHALNSCQQALGVTTTNPIDPALSGGDAQLTYCPFSSLTDCGYKTLTGEITPSIVDQSPSASAGPSNDHSTGNGKYVGISVYTAAGSRYYTSSTDVKSGTIESPMFDPATFYCIQFWYGMSGNDAYGLDVNIRIGGGVGYPVWTKMGQQDAEWKLGEVELDSEYTANPFKIDFVFKTDAYYDHYHGRGVNRYGDIGLDDVYVYNTSCSAVPKCPPQSISNTIGNVTSCYTLHAEPKSWDDAFDTCRREGAYSALVSIESQDEQDFLVNLINNDPVFSVVGKDGFYTSGNDLDQEHEFVWPDTGTKRKLTYTNWHVGQPNNVGGNQDCLLMEYQRDNFQWGDVDCTTQHPFICEVYYTI